MLKSFKELIKNKKKNNSFEKKSIAILSDQSTQFLAKVLVGTGIEYSIDYILWEAPIDQIENQIHNPLSKLNEGNFNTVIVFESTHKLLNYFNACDQKNNFAKEQYSRISDYLEVVLEQHKSIIFFNFYEVNDFVFGNFSSKIDESFIYQVRKLNFLLSEFYLKKSNLSILDISSIQNYIGSDQLLNYSFYVNYEMILNLDALPVICKGITDIILAKKAVIKKCLIVDLDNTLWGGIIGDDGIENIELGDLGVGKSFIEFQSWIKKLKDRGVIVCVCSKNNEETAKDVFLNHPKMVLKLDDISVFIANWNSKVDNIKYIKSILNIGFDSMVFLDDNPFERNIVRDNIEGILVPDLPEDPSLYVDFMYKQNIFETDTLSYEDKGRTKMYQNEHLRIEAKQNFTDLSNYMQSLGMVSKIEHLNRFNIPRVSQLSLRSNQFNLRTIRYSEKELEKIMASKDYISFVFSLSDKFGDHGIISYVILKIQEDKNLFIENWAMSCRVIERGVEEFVLNSLIDFGLKKKYDGLFGEYIETKKNVLVKDLFVKLGFTNIKKDYYKISLQKKGKLKTTIKNEQS